MPSAVDQNDIGKLNEEKLVYTDVTNLVRLKTPSKDRYSSSVRSVPFSPFSFLQLKDRLLETRSSVFTECRCRSLEEGLSD